ncbi:Repeat domain-containing protein [Alteromonadaceae bacterium Bs31]|nr:Repeat domain-containing protein [Alteromonadaceae bacterium Bs31]
MKKITLLSAILALSGYSHSATEEAPKTVPEIVAMVNHYCGVCHGVPSPSLMPKKDWPYVTKAMAELALERTGQEFISKEALHHISAYYFGSAPESLERLPYFTRSPAELFTVKPIGDPTPMPQISNIARVQLDKKASAQFLISDIEKNQLLLLSKKGKKWTEAVIAEIKAPVGIEVLDYDGDGDDDIAVASLGRILPPFYTTMGKLVLLRQDDKGKFHQEILLENVPRVLDVAAQDMDGDKDLDLLVSIYGADNIGELAWLENRGKEKPVKHTLVPLGGGLNITPGDINGDGLLDLVSLVTQEHEMIIALVNAGDGNFDYKMLFKASEPMIGSTSMSLVDMDGDKDLDILFANGDAHDLQYDPKPYHGVQWLENKGQLDFQFHNLARFYGAALAKAADMDGDGDKDVVASSWNNYWDDEQRQTLIWFENDGKQNFTSKGIAHKPSSIVSFELEDVNGDGLPDIIAGTFKIDELKATMGKEEAEIKKSLQGVENTRLFVIENPLTSTKPK